MPSRVNPATTVTTFSWNEFSSWDMFIYFAERYNDKPYLPIVCQWKKQNRGTIR
jgi:hypothetical protein